MNANTLMLLHNVTLLINSSTDDDDFQE